MINSFKDDYFFLSNFYPVEIHYDGIFYHSIEHAYQAAKSLNYFEKFEISKLATAALAKKAGRKVQLRHDWNEARVYVMWDLVKKKFENEELKSKLVDTGDEELIEGNYWKDYFWGMCNGKGENYLGRILMHIRKKLRSEIEFCGLQPLLTVR